MKTTTLSKYEKAKLRVASIRGFYNHLSIFMIVNILLYLLRHQFTFTLVDKVALGNPEFLQWIDWNVFGTTIIWGLVLAIHGINVLGNVSLFKREWEQRQVQKYMNKNSH